MTLIDGFSLVFLPGGIKSYLISLLTALNDAPQAKDNRFMLLIPHFDPSIKAYDYSDVKELEESLTKNITVTYVPVAPFLMRILQLLRLDNPSIRRYSLFIWERFYMPSLVKKYKPTVVFHPYQTVSNYKTTAQKVVVIHDIFHWTQNQQYNPLVRYLYDSYKAGCRNCDTVITISQTSKKEIEDYLHIDSKKIAVCYEGVNNSFLAFKPSSSKEKIIQQQYNLPQKYFFCLASLRDYKNTLGAVKVWHLVHEKNKEIKLVLLGWSVHENSPVTQYIQTHNLSSDILTIPKIKQYEDLFYLYSLSYLFIFISFKEGFGLPPLEALACNTLPIISNVSALGELYNKDLPTFNPTDYKGIADFILSLSETKQTEIISHAKKILLTRYSWQHVLSYYLPYITQ